MENFFKGAYTLRGMVGDPDNNRNWLINGKPHCENVQPDNGGLSQCTVIFELNDTDIALEVFDPVAGGFRLRHHLCHRNPQRSDHLPLSTSTLRNSIHHIEWFVGDAEDPVDRSLFLGRRARWRPRRRLQNTRFFGNRHRWKRLSEGEHLLTSVLDSTGKNDVGRHYSLSRKHNPNVRHRVSNGWRYQQPSHRWL